ncbi:MAG: nucleotidyl transferase AbiEii/AbiGii toxin family protein [Candidatus Anstonellales archaeon]
MEETLWKKWEFLKTYRDILILKAVEKIPKRIKSHLVLTGGTSLHLFSLRQFFNDEPVMASEDVDFFNTNPKLLENPKGVEEWKIAEIYARVLKDFGFESDLKSNILLVKPHDIKIEFFYDSSSYPEKTYSYSRLKIIHPKTLYRIKLNLLNSREEISERDLIDVLYLSTKFGLPEKILLRENIERMLEWKTLQDYLTEHGERILKNNYPGLVKNFLSRVVVHEED